MVAVIATASGCTTPPSSPPDSTVPPSLQENAVAAVRSTSPPAGRSHTIALQKDGGTYSVPVIINGIITLDFLLDSGADTVAIPVDVALTLMHANKISASDFTGLTTYIMADGTNLPSPNVVIHTLKVGTVTLANVEANIVPLRGSPLLGQSFLGRFRSWSIDNSKRALVIEE